MYVKCAKIYQSISCVLFLQYFYAYHSASGTANKYVEGARKLQVPKFLSTNPNLYHNVGETAVLECAVENLGDRKVSWRKASADKVLTVGLMDFVNDPRMEVEHPPDSTQWNLVIRNLQREDAGVYECQVSSKIRHLRHYVTLLVQDIKITGKNFVDEGEKIVLTCSATGQDQPVEDVDWFREGNRLQIQKNIGISIEKHVTLSTRSIVSKLEITKARLVDAGVYVCRTSGLDITSFRVIVLDGDTYNVKRGTEVDDTHKTILRQLSNSSNVIIGRFVFACIVFVSIINYRAFFSEILSGFW